MKFTVRNGGEIYKGIAAEVIGRELEKIRKRGKGKLVTIDVVEAARPDDAALHPAFNWDDGEAAELWRRQEAMQLIRQVVVQRTEDSEPESAFVHVRVEDPYYQSTAVVASSVTEFQAAMKEATVRLAKAQEAVEELRRIAGQGEQNSDISVIAIAAEAISTARMAMERLHVN